MTGRQVLKLLRQLGCQEVRTRSGAVHRKEVDALIYRVDIVRDESGAWLARVPDVPGCHTYGRTLEQARRRIREALDLWVSDAAHSELEFRVRLPADVRAEIKRARAARERSARAQLDAHDATVHAAKDLTEGFGLSLRDASELLELSYQRVHQLVSQ